MNEITDQRTAELFKYDGLHSIRDFIRWSCSHFNQAGLFFGHGSDNALDEANHLVFQVLDLPWDLPESYLDCSLTSDEKEAIAGLVSRRINERKPLAYLLNQAWFCGLPYYVDERVLIPRSPISELIGERFMPWLDGVQVHRALDLCCGSGCIGLAMAQEFTDAKVDLLDISDDALEVSRINIDRYELWECVSTMQSDLFATLDALDSKPCYQLIVSNPPYVDEDDLSDMPEEFSHEPRLGLAAGWDGLFFAHRILAQAADYLDDEGILVLEVGNSQWALRDAYPDVPFIWPEFDRGGHGVLVLKAEDCRKYQSLFREQCL